MKLKEVLKYLTGYYFIILCENNECICTNHEDYPNFPKATEEILKQYEEYKVSEINGAYDGGTSPWIDLYIKEEN